MFGCNSICDGLICVLVVVCNCVIRWIVLCIVVIDFFSVVMVLMGMLWWLCCSLCSVFLMVVIFWLYDIGVGDG